MQYYTSAALAALTGIGLLPLASGITTGFGDYADLCPVACTPNPSQWTKYHGIDRLSGCEADLLFDFNTLLKQVDSNTIFRTCSLASDASAPTDLAELASSNTLSVDSGCGAKMKQQNVTIATSDTGTAQVKSASNVAPGDVEAATNNLATYLKDHASCGSSTLFSKVSNAVVGLYSGADVQQASAAALLERFGINISSGRTILQTCGNSGSGADTTVGIVSGSLQELGDSLHSSVRAWANGTCVEGLGASSTPHMLSVLVSSTAASNSTTSAAANRRGECRDTQVHTGDSCGSLASRCGISGPAFEKYNSGVKNLCSTLKDKQYVCCSSGTLPDHRPKPGSDGSCNVHKIEKNDGCWAIADKFGITQDDIEKFNKKTWGWAGCDHLQPDQLICLSTGRPPFPLPVEGAKCGPMKPGSKPIAGDDDYSKVSPCPLNACCDTWGFCGITDDFCTKTPADTGAPGTAKEGTNGCISNCGTDIKKSDPPSSFMKIAYYEAWNFERDCLHMNVDAIKGDYTHIHFAFATVDKNWGVSLDKNIQKQFDRFKSMKGPKKILSFGGWAFSTEPDTYQRFRDATKAENRDKFASSVAKFVSDNSLDGLDFDWEYPGAPDIPNVPPGSTDEGSNYLAFLKVLKGKLAKGKSVSIALPSSFWYLQAYPVKDLNSAVDYFIYMTYDLHGQWDYNNKYTTPGCANGNCIRSHVNITETKTSLAMATKAGLSSNKVVVGVASYGRSFRLQRPGCFTPDCLFTGSPTQSDAFQGRCTNTSGYISNAELKEIADKKKYSYVKSWYDKDSDSNIMVYGDGPKHDWVAYMDDDIKGKRVDLYKGYNMAGTTDWAVDLDEFLKDDGGNPDDPTNDPSKLTCKDAKMSYKNQDISPIYFDTYGDALTTYVVIVNLTPHKFKMTSTSHYQYDIDFKDVYPGSMMQGAFSRGSGGSPVDDHAEIYYDVEGTDKKFVIRLTNNDKGTGTFERVICDLRGIGIGSRELNVPGQVPLVITGSKRAGFRSSLLVDQKVAGWMQSIKDTIKDRRVKDVVLPGTHDSAMSTISHKLITAADSPNTQTQGMSIYDQLRLGARWFDLRVISVHGTSGLEGSYDFYGAHVNDESMAACIGNTGQSLDDIVSDINKFTSENPGEVMFFRVRYMVGIRKVPSLGPIHWGGDDWSDLYDDFLDRMQKVNNRCLNIDGDFGGKKMGTFMDMNGGKGCVIFLLSPTDFNGNPYRPEYGLYDAGKLVITDDWADTESTKDMVNRETKDWQDPLKYINIHIGQWLLTSQGIDAVSWDNYYEAMQVNPLIYSHGVNEMSPTAWPGVLMVDYLGETWYAGHDFADTGAELATLAVGLNQYMLSENCDVSSIYPPLLDYPEGYKDKSANQAMSKLDAADEEQWNGFIFANGTVIDHPSPDVGVYNGPHKDDAIITYYS